MLAFFTAYGFFMTPPESIQASSSMTDKIRAGSIQGTTFFQ
jgi:hypothetical protein